MIGIKIKTTFSLPYIEGPNTLEYHSPILQTSLRKAVTTRASSLCPNALSVQLNP